MELNALGISREDVLELAATKVADECMRESGEVREGQRPIVSVTLTHGGGRVTAQGRTFLEAVRSAKAKLLNRIAPEPKLKLTR